MSGFVETLVAPRIHQQDDQEMNMMGGGQKQEDNAIFCLINQPNEDKGGKKTPKKKKSFLERLNLHVPTVAEMSRAQEVQMVSISIACPARPEIVLSQPFTSSPKAYLFTLKEGTKYKLSFSFIVSSKLVSGLKYENTLWKAGIRVDKCAVMLGTYSPQEKPYVFQLKEQTLPCGVFVRGSFSARTKVSDSEGKCYMDIHYYFNITKTWPSISS